jgi:hypothetical protein
MAEPRSEGDLSTGMVVENGGLGMLIVGTGEEQSWFVMENVLCELGNIGGVTEEPEGEKEEIFSKVSDPVIQPEPCQSVEFQFGRRKGVGCIGGEGFSSEGTPRELEAPKELSSFVVQTEPCSEVVEGGVGDELEGFGPLSFMPLAVQMDKDSSSSVSPRWVVERVKSYTTN